MTASDKKKAQVLVGLILIAGLTWYFVYRPGVVSSSNEAEKKKPGGKVAAAKKPQDPTIHIELLGGDAAAGEVGRKNIFQYRQKPLPPGSVNSVPKPIPGPIVTNTQPPPPYVAPTPQPPPFKAFKYDGLSFAGSSKNGKMVASLTEGTNSYQVKLGECLMGQYCVRQITENMIEIEDLQLKQRKQFTRTPPQ